MGAYKVVLDLLEVPYDSVRLVINSLLVLLALLCIRMMRRWLK